VSLAVRHTEKLEWRKLVVPAALREAPIHRWFVFPHSFTDGLVRGLIEEWGLGPGDRILDPFVGAGTTVLTAKQMGIPAQGVDLSPLAVFVTNAKVGAYDPESVRIALEDVLGDFAETDIQDETKLLRRAFTNTALRRLCGLRQCIGALGDASTRNLLFLALIAMLRDFSSIRADGGWLRVGQPHLRAHQVLPRFEAIVESMIDDLPNEKPSPVGQWHAQVGDARETPADGEYTAVITSPPYPNRHDYSRIFGIELEFAFLDEAQTYSLRHESIRSHPEARPPSAVAAGYAPPARLAALLDELKSQQADRRVPVMLAGYFEDMYLVLNHLRRRLATGARLAFVVGNARYSGVRIPVDELLADVATTAGYQPLEIRAVRYRGNSAQQMGRFGRERSKESCVMLRYGKTHQMVASTGGRAR
jgi:hypothetical protein